MPRRRRAPTSESVRHTIVELWILAVFGIVMALVVLPFAVTWANGVHLQFPGGSSAGQPSDSPIVSPAGGPGGVTGMITAGPVCPVEQSPLDPKCAPRPVAGAIVVATDAIGDEVGRTTSLAGGPAGT